MHAEVCADVEDGVALAHEFAHDDLFIRLDRRMRERRSSEPEVRIEQAKIDVERRPVRDPDRHGLQRFRMSRQQQRHACPASKVRAIVGL
jgi:hypothetical protein